MTLHRLLDDPVDDFESVLLRSAQADLPNDAEVRRGIAALGVAATGAFAASAAAASSIVTASGAVAPAASAHGALGAAVIAKWLGVGFIAGAVASGGGVLIAPASRTTPIVAHGERTRAPLTTVTTAPSPALAEEAQLLEATAASVPSEPRARTRAFATAQSRPAVDAATRGTDAPPVPPPSDPAAPATSPLTAELAALSRARLAQSARAPAQALVELDEYDHLPRPHVLEGEASLLRMEALIQVGQQVGAARLAREYLRTHPGSPHRSRLQQIASGE